MTRGLASANLTALEAETVRVVFFLELELPSGTVRYHTGLGTRTVLGEDWLGVGALATIDALEEGQGLRPYPLRLGLSGLDAGLAVLAVNEEFQERPARLLVGFEDELGALVADPDVWFQGTAQELAVTTGDQEEGEIIALTCESDLLRFERRSNLRYTAEALQYLHPDDEGLQYMPQMRDARVRWRGENQALAGTGGTPAGGNDPGRRSPFPGVGQVPGGQPWSPFNR